jgi:hypothetical protein
VQAVADTVCRLVDLAIADPAIVELEVNPLLVLVPGGGAHAVDALILEAA